MDKNVIEFFDRVLEWYNQGDLPDILYLDFSKAFDQVRHKRLIKNMTVTGLRGMSYDG